MLKVELVEFFQFWGGNHIKGEQFSQKSSPNSVLFIQTALIKIRGRLLCKKASLDLGSGSRGGCKRVVYRKRISSTNIGNGKVLKNGRGICLRQLPLGKRRVLGQVAKTQCKVLIETSGLDICECHGLDCF